MGSDPFDISDAEAGKLIDAASSLKHEVQTDFFEAADSAQFEQQLAWVSEGLQFTRTQNADLPRLKEVKQQLAMSNTGKLPWMQGYDLARRFRDLVDLKDRERVDIVALGLGDPIKQALNLSDQEKNRDVKLVVAIPPNAQSIAVEDLP